MAQAPRAIRHEELLAQMGWVQGLARSLVGDPNLAQDIAQETWLTALERPPRTAHSGPSLRAWLATVTRTAARQRMRSRKRRSAREKKAAAPEVTDAPTAADIVERGEMQQEVAAAVMALAEPYRSAVLYRYLDGLSAPEIAERTGATPAAVRKRLSRGLAQLRESLDRDHDGDCRGWLAALLPPALVTTAPAPAAEAAGAAEAARRVAWLGNTKLQFAALLVVLVSAWFALRPLSGWGGAGEVGPTTDGGSDGAVTLPLVSAPTSLPEVAPVEPLAADAAPAPSFDARTYGDPLRALTARLHGRAYDVDGMPMADMRVRFEPTAYGTGPDSAQGLVTATTLTGPDGRFELTAARRNGRILAASSSLVTLIAGNVERHRTDVEQSLVVVPRRPLAGQVIDPNGEPLSGVTLALHLPDGFGARIDGAMDMASLYHAQVTTGPDGRFELPDAPGVDGLSYSISGSGYEPHRAPAPDHSDLAMLITLQRPAASLSGRVLDAGGNPAGGALVAHGRASTRADEHGFFTIYLATGATPTVPEGVELSPEQRALVESIERRLIAVLPGHQPAELNVDPDPESGEPAWPDPLVLQLGPQPRTLSGLVTDAGGAPMQGMTLWVADPTLLTVAEIDARYQNVELSRAQPGVTRWFTLVENVLAGVPDEDWHAVRTDEDGRFEVSGLLDRDYTLVAMNPWTLTRVESEPLAAGRDDVTLVLDGGALINELHGRVVDRFDQPVAGAWVDLRTASFRVAGTTFIDTRDGATTDEDGRFTLRGVPRQDVYVRVSGERVIPSEHGHAESGARLTEEPGGLRLVVSRRYDVQIALADPDEADQAVVLDEDGAALSLDRYSFGRRASRPDAAITGGRSTVFAVSDAATTLVLSRDGKEVRREPLSLGADGLNTIR
jgi:RNA polymerase sigma-70 factor (ECF subfamily)